MSASTNYTETVSVKEEPREVTLKADPRLLVVGTEKRIVGVFREPREITVKARKRSA